MCAPWPLFGNRSLDGIYGRSSSDCTCGCRRERRFPSRWVERVSVLDSKKKNRLFGWFRCSDDGIEEAHQVILIPVGSFLSPRNTFPFSLSFLEHCGELHVTTFPNFCFYNIFGTRWGTRVHFVQTTSTFPSDRAPCGELDVTIFPSPVLLQCPCLVRFLTLILGPDCTMYNLITDRVVRYCCQIY